MSWSSDTTALSQEILCFSGIRRKSDDTDPASASRNSKGTFTSSSAHLTLESSSFCSVQTSPGRVEPDSPCIAPASIFLPQSHASVKHSEEDVARMSAASSNVDRDAPHQSNDITKMKGSFAWGTGSDNSSFSQIASKSLQAYSVPPASVLEVNRSLTRSFHETPVIQSQKVEKRSLDKKTAKLLNEKYVLYPQWKLGEGSFGKVVLCYSVPDDIYFAAKIFKRHCLKVQGLGSDNGLSRLHREIEILKALRHDNIIALHEVIDDGICDKIYLIFELAAYGEVMRLTPAAELEDGEEPLPESEVKRIIRAVIEAAAFAHQKGVAHRDIKPGNILITSTHDVKLSDFGCSVCDVAEGDSITRGGSVAFLPPELLCTDTVLSRATSGHGLERLRGSNLSASNSLKSFGRQATCGSVDSGGTNDGTPSLSLASETSPLRQATASDYFSVPTLRQHSAMTFATTSSGKSSVPSSDTCHESTHLVTSALANPILPDGSYSISAESSEGIFHPEDSNTPCTHGPTSARSAMGTSPSTSFRIKPRRGQELVDFFKADVWSLGVTAFVLLFGELPWRGQSATSLHEEIVENPDPLREILLCSVVGSAPAAALGDEDSDCSEEVSPFGATLQGIEVEVPDVVDAGDALPVADLPRPLPTLSGSRQSSACARSPGKVSLHLRFRPGVPAASRTCLEFIKMCLNCNAVNRPTMEDLKNHEWFGPSRTRRPTECPVIPETLLRDSVPVEGKNEIDPSSSVDAQAGPAALGFGVTQYTVPMTTTVSVRSLRTQEQSEVPRSLEKVLQAARSGPQRALARLSFFVHMGDQSSSAHPFDGSPSSIPSTKRCVDDSVIYVATDDHDASAASDVGDEPLGSLHACGSSPYGMPSRLRRVTSRGVVGQRAIESLNDASPLSPSADFFNDGNQLLLSNTEDATHVDLSSHPTDKGDADVASGRRMTLSDYLKSLGKSFTLSADKLRQRSNVGMKSSPSVNF